MKICYYGGTDTISQRRDAKGRHSASDFHRVKNRKEDLPGEKISVRGYFLDLHPHSNV